MHVPARLPLLLFLLMSFATACPQSGDFDGGDENPREDACAEACRATPGPCAPIYGNKWNFDAACYENEQLAECGELEPQPDWVFVSVNDDGECWSINRGHPVGWQIRWSCPIGDGDGADAICDE